jgi:hypothetical protein
MQLVGFIRGWAFGWRKLVCQPYRLHEEAHLLTVGTAAVGLNVDCSRFVKRGLISEDTKNDRDHTFYVCYVQDK